jgi:hypothetical protein
MKEQKPSIEEPIEPMTSALAAALAPSFEGGLFAIDWYGLRRPTELDPAAQSNAVH